MGSAMWARSLLCVGYGAGAVLRKALAVLAFAAAPANAQDITLLAMGDSLTAGYGLPQGDGFVPQLEAWLRAQGA